MEYTDFICDFARRTLRNLDHVQAHAIAETDNDVYPVTQLWNSLLGLIVLPRELDVTRIPRLPMADLWSRGWPAITVSGQEHPSLREFVGALRNAVAHFNVKFMAGSDREITAVEVWTQALDGNRRPIRDSRGWVGRMTVAELECLARRVAELYLKEFASNAA